MSNPTPVSYGTVPPLVHPRNELCTEVVVKGEFQEAVVRVVFNGFHPNAGCNYFVTVKVVHYPNQPAYEYHRTVEYVVKPEGMTGWMGNGTAMRELKRTVTQCLEDCSWRWD